MPLEQWKPIYDQFAAQCRAEHDEVVAMGGLHILGTERHEARRIDNQLRGRAGRQGDPGSSRFFLSLEDDLLRIFGGERVKALMYRLGMTEGVPIESRLISKRIENAQKAVEAQNFEARKHLLEYDDVMNKQRETIYSLRRSFLEGRDQKEYVLERAEAIAEFLARGNVLPARTASRPVERHAVWQRSAEPVWHRSEVRGNRSRRAESRRARRNAARKSPRRATTRKKQLFGEQMLRWLERHILLDIVDAQWKDHLLTLDHLKEGIGLRGYGQKDPLVEFKKEAFTLFEDMMDRIDTEAVRFLFLDAARPARGRSARRSSSASGASSRICNFRPAPRRPRLPSRSAAGAKVGRNDPCPCGSGKKYKKCHGASA